MSNIVFKTGDLIQSDAGRIDDDEWYGIILEGAENQPKVYPIYATKYKIKWCKGTMAWHWGTDIKLISRATK